MPKVKTARVTKLKKNPTKCIACDKTRVRADIPLCWGPIIQSDEKVEDGFNYSICITCMKQDGYEGQTKEGKKYHIKKYILLSSEAREVIPRVNGQVFLDNPYTKDKNPHIKHMGWLSYCGLVFYNDDEYTSCCNSE
jgi:hypothetical protein